MSGKNQCKPCHKMATAAYEKSDKCQGYRKEYAKTEQKKAYRKAYYNGHKEQSRVLHFKRKYGLTMEELAEMFAKQNGRCAICGIPGNETLKGLVVDHNHKTDRIHGLLCNVCNSHIVHVVEDYPHLLEKAKTYLGRSL